MQWGERNIFMWIGANALPKYASIQAAAQRDRPKTPSPSAGSQ